MSNRKSNLKLEPTPTLGKSVPQRYRESYDIVMRRVRSSFKIVDKPTTNGEVEKRKK